jgi:hypothetical protein
MEYGSEEAFGDELKVIISFGFPSSINPFENILLRGP